VATIAAVPVLARRAPASVLRLLRVPLDAGAKDAGSKGAALLLPLLPAAAGGAPGAGERRGASKA
jgi:hypothetical protein